MTPSYIGSGPYCYANSLAMVLGAAAPEPSLIEVLTGSPFGMQILPGDLAFFDPVGWDPGIGLNAAMGLLGWSAVQRSCADEAEAVGRLRETAARGPILVGPLEIGLLLHHPGSGTAIGSDHYAVVLEAEREVVRFHDPHGFPYATMPMKEFIAAWRADSIDYAQPFTLRTDFVQTREVDQLAALRASIPQAIRWLEAGQQQVPPDHGLPGNGAAAERLAELLEDGLRPDQIGHLTYFAIRVGARRLADGSNHLGQLGCARAAKIMDHQARLVGSLQYDIGGENNAAAADSLRRLAPSYGQLAEALKTQM